MPCSGPCGCADCAPVPVAAGGEAMRRACIEKVKEMATKKSLATWEDVLAALEAIDVKGEKA